MNNFFEQLIFPNLFLFIISLVIFVAFIAVTFVSLYENEYKAAVRAFLFSVLLPIPFLLFSFYQYSITESFSSIVVVLIILFGIILLIPFNFRRGLRFKNSTGKIDERNIMFSRWELEKGSEKFDEYYSKFPNRKILDDKFRTAPGLLKKGSAFYNPFHFASADASFYTVDALKSKVDGEPAKEKIGINKMEITNYIKQWTKYLGALDIGITELKDYHLYSHIGRGAKYGDKVKLDHKYAIAFTVEMNNDMVKSAPAGPIVMESAREYLASGVIAVQLSEFIRQLGYPARAHIDGNYYVVCPLVAKDAGLGEIGRMGLLMTPKYGPRVRIAVVTTNLPLLVDKPTHNLTVLDFCLKCKKCADTCPAKAIPNDTLISGNEIQHWQIKQEACFTYWCNAGTDCGRCMAVCPYSHPNNFIHNFIRWGIGRNYLFRQIAIKFDNILYGKKPAPAKPKGWLNIT